jgi:hypothetical protein
MKLKMVEGRNIWAFGSSTPITFKDRSKYHEHLYGRISYHSYAGLELSRGQFVFNDSPLIGSYEMNVENPLLPHKSAKSSFKMDLDSAIELERYACSGRKQYIHDSIYEGLSHHSLARLRS